MMLYLLTKLSSEHKVSLNSTVKFLNLLLVKEFLLKRRLFQKESEFGVCSISTGSGTSCFISEYFNSKYKFMLPFHITHNIYTRDKGNVDKLKECIE